VSGLVRRSGVPASELASLSDDQLRTAARGLWQDLYGEPYAPVLP
jgi:hypothetical protein